MEPGNLIPIPAGAHVLKAEATDSSGLKGSATKNIEGITPGLDGEISVDIRNFSPTASRGSFKRFGLGGDTGALSLDGTTYTEGFQLNGSQDPLPSITYRIAQAYDWLTFIAGVDDSTPQGSARFLVRLDGAVAFRSTNLAASLDAKPYSISLSGATEVTLEYVSGDVAIDFRSVLLRTGSLPIPPADEDIELVIDGQATSLPVILSTGWATTARVRAKDGTFPASGIVARVAMDSTLFGGGKLRLSNDLRAEFEDGVEVLPLRGEPLLPGLSQRFKILASQYVDVGAISSAGWVSVVAESSSYADRERIFVTPEYLFLNSYEISAGTVLTTDVTIVGFQSTVFTGSAAEDGKFFSSTSGISFERLASSPNHRRMNMRFHAGSSVPGGALLFATETVRRFEVPSSGRGGTQVKGWQVSEVTVVPTIDGAGEAAPPAPPPEPVTVLEFRHDGPLALVEADDPAAHGELTSPKDGAKVSPGQVVDLNVLIVDKDQARQPGAAAWRDFSPPAQWEGTYEVVLTLTNAKFSGSTETTRTMTTQRGEGTGVLTAQLIVDETWDGATPVKVGLVIRDRLRIPNGLLALGVAATACQDPESEAELRWTMAVAGDFPTTVEPITQDPGEVGGEVAADMIKVVYKYGPDKNGLENPAANYQGITVTERFPGKTLNLRRTWLHERLLEAHPEVRTDADAVNLFLPRQIATTFTISRLDTTADIHKGKVFNIPGRRSEELLSDEGRKATIELVLQQVYEAPPGTVLARYKIIRRRKGSPDGRAAEDTLQKVPDA